MDCNFAPGRVYLLTKKLKSFLKLSMFTEIGFSLEEALANPATSGPFTVCGIIVQFSQNVPVNETSGFNRYGYPCLSNKLVTFNIFHA
jgi:hypothetical protein